MGHRQISTLPATRRERVRRKLALVDRVSTVLLPLAGIHPTAPAGVCSPRLLDAALGGASALPDAQREAAQGCAVTAAVNNNRQQSDRADVLPTRRQRPSGERGSPTLAAAGRLILEVVGYVALALLVALVWVASIAALASVSGCSSANDRKPTDGIGQAAGSAQTIDSTLDNIGYHAAALRGRLTK